MKTIKTLCTLLCVMLLPVLSATAQNTDDNKNKAIIEANDGNHELNTDEISVIRFDGGKITVVQPWGETTFDRTLRSLSFKRPNPGMLRLTVNTTIGTEGGSNRAQGIDGDGKLKSTWASGDVVYVYADASTTTSIGTLTPKSTDYGKSQAILSGDINFEGIADGEKTLYFSTKDRSTLDLSTQNGTVESLFYFTAQANVTVDGGNAFLNGTLNFTRPIAVVKFMLKDKGNSDAEISTKSFTVHDGTNTYTVTPATPTDELFVGIPGISNKTVTLTATDGNDYYLYQKTGVSFTNNAYYTINVKMEASDLARPLTFEAKTAGATVAFTKGANAPSVDNIEYSTDGGVTWAEYTYGTGIQLTSVGDKVSFRGTNARYATGDSDDKYSYFSCSDDCYIYGNVMSLINKDNYAINTSLTGHYAFCNLFYNNENIYNHPTKSLKLPATTLSQYCYLKLFNGCTKLSSAPDLPATTLTHGCYYHMFSGCTGLISAPTLPATTLASSCYCCMFYNCTGLTSAPALPATTLASTCYSNMFYGCISLATAPELPATTLAGYCYDNMFNGCTNLTSAPVLPAATLAYWCYSYMFKGCTSLNSVTCLATDISASYCTYYWLSGVAASGTFYKPASMNDWTTGASGIPSGWTTENYVEGALKGKFTINSAGGKVYFSQGNLQYQASTSTWRFAEHQYDYVGGADNGNVYVGETKCNNANISGSYFGWIDLFGWGTGDAPTKATQNSGDYSTFTDWGTNAISNGGNTANMWSTLTKDEWAYIFEHHTKGWSTVNGVNGYVIRPDGISTAVAASYTASEWAAEEAAGSVFLPAACSRGGTTFNTGSWGDYWSSTPSNSDDAYYLYFHSGGQNPANSACRWGGRSVRLVYETPYFQGAGTEQDPYLISSEADWNYLAIKVNSGTSYAEKFFRQTANIDVTTMVGNSSDSKPFSGTYDGDGKTLNLSLNTSTPHTAPFRFIADATIKNVVTTGTVHSTSNHPSGLVGFTDGNCTIQNCRVGANVGGAQHSGGIVGHCYHANISIIGCVYSGTLTPASGQWTGGIIGWGGDGGGHTISISDCLFAGTLTGSTKFHPIGILQNQNNTKYLSNTYYTLGAQNTNDDASFVKGLAYKGKFARSITAGTDVTTVANAGAATVYDVSGITSYGTGILYGGVLYAGNGEAISLTLSHSAAPTGFSFTQYTVSGGGTLANPTTNSPTLFMTDANQTINVQWAPPGTINSLFSINSGGTKVYFSKGNLLLSAANTWKFADNQYDYFGESQSDNHRDLFGWGTGNNPNQTSTNSDDYSTFTDWGTAAASSIGSGWRTLTGGTGGEWEWMLGPLSSPNPGTNCRTSSTVNSTANARFAKATVAGKSGIIIFPDSYTHPSDVTQPASINTENAAFTVNNYDATAWGKMESAGAVFLPAAGYRYGSSVYDAGSIGRYWSSAIYNPSHAYNVYFSSSNLAPVSFLSRFYGYSVRLVRQVE